MVIYRLHLAGHSRSGGGLRAAQSSGMESKGQRGGLSTWCTGVLAYCIDDAELCFGNGVEGRRAPRRVELDGIHIAELC